MDCQVCGRGKDQASVHLIVTAEFQFETIYSKQQPRPRLGQHCQKAKVLTNRQWATGLDRSLARNCRLVYLVASLASLVRLDEQKCLLVTI